jgi:hypothetical protein
MLYLKGNGNDYLVELYILTNLSQSVGLILRIYLTVFITSYSLSLAHGQALVLCDFGKIVLQITHGLRPLYPSDHGHIFLLE